MDEVGIERESMEFDVVIVGAGPSGLAAAIRLRQLAGERGHDLSVCVVEKGSEVGAHILSGAVLEPRALEELFPDWREREAPLNTPVSEERFLFLTERGGFPWPNGLLPPSLKNHGNYIISLGNFCRWLAAQAEELGDERGSKRAFGSARAPRPKRSVSSRARRAADWVDGRVSLRQGRPKSPLTPSAPSAMLAHRPGSNGCDHEARRLRKIEIRQGEYHENETYGTR